MNRPLYVAIGVDCDPDRDAYPERLAWRGIEALPRLWEGLPQVRWTLNVRADTQVRDYCGSAAHCLTEYRRVWDEAVEHGSEVAWHLHYFGRNGARDVSDQNVLDNIRVGAEAIGPPKVVHMGWTFQNAFSVQQLYQAGVRIDYSPVPRLAFAGRGGTDAYDWSRWAYRPRLWHGVRMIPAYSFRHRLLARRFGTERVMLTTTTAPFLYRLLLADFFRSGSDFFVTYFHADELVPAVGGWRDRLYAFDHLATNLRTLERMARHLRFDVRYVTISRLAEVLFDEDRLDHA
jgi:hypothetical protein